MPGWLEVWGPEAVGGILGAVVAVVAALLISTRVEERIARRIVDYEHERQLQREQQAELSARADRARTKVLGQLRTRPAAQVALHPDFVYLPEFVRLKANELIAQERTQRSAEATYSRRLEELAPSGSDATPIEELLAAEPADWQGPLGGPDPASAIEALWERQSRRITSVPWNRPLTIAERSAVLASRPDEVAAVRLAYREVRRQRELAEDAGRELMSAVAEELALGPKRR